VVVPSPQRRQFRLSVKDCFFRSPFNHLLRCSLPFFPNDGRIFGGCLRRRRLSVQELLGTAIVCDLVWSASKFPSIFFFGPVSETNTRTEAVSTKNRRTINSQRSFAEQPFFPTLDADPPPSLEIFSFCHKIPQQIGPARII